MNCTRGLGRRRLSAQVSAKNLAVRAGRGHRDPGGGAQGPESGRAGTTTQISTFSLSSHSSQQLPDTCMFSCSIIYSAICIDITKALVRDSSPFLGVCAATRMIRQGCVPISCKQRVELARDTRRGTWAWRTLHPYPHSPGVPRQDRLPPALGMSSKAEKPGPWGAHSSLHSGGLCSNRDS